MKKIFTTLFFAATTLMGFAAEWIDVTDEYIINPRYDNNDISTGWMGTSLGSANPKENAEHYQKNYNTYQELSGLKPGKYRVSLSAFYRMGSADNDYNLYSSGDYSDYQYAQLYAISSVDDYYTPIAPSSSAALPNSLGGGVSQVGGEWNWGSWTRTGGYYIPNNMEAADYWFRAGHYLNTVECEVGSDGVLFIGIRKEYTLDGDWTCIDNWKLEYWGTAIPVTSIELNKSDVEMAVSETLDLTATVNPADATYRNVEWSSTNESVATVDSKGQVTAVGVGTCYIVATSKDQSGKKAQCKVTVVKNEPSAENIIINEIMASNVDVYLDPSMNYGSWVELYNPTSRSVTLGGLYVSDDPQNLKKHRLIDTYGAIPAKGYALLNFDHFEVWTEAAYRQIDDKLDCDGGTIIISDGKTILAQQDYPEAISRTSYARTTDGGNEWSMTGNPSPGASNQASGGFATTQLETPVVDKDAQLFTGSLQISVNIPTGATLRYTTDGTAPTLTNGKTSATGLFNISETTCYRFRFFRNGYLPSKVVTRTYIYNSGNEPFPIISVVTDRNNLYDTERGVFMKGPHGRPGNGQTVNCNWNMDWDRPVAFEFITEDNECVVSQECDFSMCGGWSRAWTPHSFKLKAKKTYDLNNTFNTHFFDKKPFLKHKTLQIRNGGNDTSCRIKDAAVQMVVANSGIDVDYQEWQPVHVFINGSPYAVLNMREPNNKDFAYSNFGIDTDEMDQFEISPDSNYVQMRGTDESFLRLVELSENAADEETYAEIRQLLDIDEYINYMAVELYVGGTDWPQNNVKGYRDVNDGKFRFVLFDLDFALSTNEPLNTFFDKQYKQFPNNDVLHGYDYSKGRSIEGTNYWEELKFVTLFKNMLANDSFRKQFIDTFCIMGGSIYQPDKVEAIINKMANNLSSGGYVNPWSSANSLISGFRTRNSNMTNHLKTYDLMQLSSAERQSVSLSANIDAAKILVNDIELPYTEFNGYLFSPITLKAEAPAGYRFAGWASENSSNQKAVFPTKSSWKYYETGSLDGQDWTASTYSDTSWKSGTAPIGYGKNQQTVVTNTYRSCYYFRKSFTLTSAPAENEAFVLNFTIDDGMIVYVNGTEAGRYNMPSGSVNYNTAATSYAPGNPDTGSMTLDGSLFRQGSNVIAVEVHNNSTSSSDILWDASLAKVTKTYDYVSTQPEYTMPTSGSQVIEAVFEALSDEDMLAEGITPIRVNEVSAANSIYVNDYFKKDDWAELYNTTGQDIDIAGMYISDNTDKPQKYQVPSDDINLNTIIPAHGYKIIWCDKRENIGSDIHANFKLAAEGGDVLITTSTYTDVLHYDAHLDTQTFGRYPDGGNDTYVMNIPSIAKANQLSSYDELYIKPIEPEPDPVGVRSYTKEGGMTIAYADGAINVKSEDSPILSVSLYNASGMKVAATQFSRSNNQFVSVNVATLSKGIYIVSATNADGDECHIKFVIK